MGSITSFWKKTIFWIYIIWPESNTANNYWLVVGPLIGSSLIETGNMQARVTFYTQVAKRTKISAIHLPSQKRCLYTIQQMLVTSLNVFRVLFPVLLQNRNVISSKCSSVFQNSLTEGVIDLQNMQVYVLRHFFE